MVNNGDYFFTLFVIVIVVCQMCGLESLGPGQLCRCVAEACFPNRPETLLVRKLFASVNFTDKAFILTFKQILLVWLNICYF